MTTQRYGIFNMFLLVIISESQPSTLEFVCYASRYQFVSTNPQIEMFVYTFRCFF